MSKKSKAKRRKKPATQDGIPKRSRTPPESNPSVSSRQIGGKWAVPVIVTVVVAMLLYFWFKPLSTPELIEQVRNDYSSGNYGLVIDGVAELAKREAVNPELLMIGADSARSWRHFDRALEFMDRIDDDQGELSAEARVSSGEILFDMGKAAESEKQFRRALSINPDHVRANQRLSILLNIVGRRWESATYAFKALKDDKLDFEQLVLFSNRNPSADVGPAIDLFIEQGNGDPRAKLTAARELVIAEKADSAIGVLKEIVKADPENVEAQVFLGRAYWATNNSKGFAKWFTNASFKLRKHPDFWNVVGDWARVHDQKEAAAKAYWEALRRDPDIQNANYHLAKLVASGDVTAPQEFAGRLSERSKDVRELNSALADVMEQRDHLTLAKNGDDLKLIVENLEKLGRNWEAFAWARQIVRIDANAHWAADRQDKLKSNLNDSTGRYAGIPANSMNLADLPVLRIDQEGTPPDQTVPRGKIRFVNATKSSGIDFTFFNARTDDHRVLYMYELMGASAAVVDFNVDGRPDIYFPQGTDWPIDPAQTEFHDKLFMNRGDGTFVEISAHAKIFQNGFGQNAAVGDFDADGFPDIFIANINGNRLLRNNGDGSYSDVTNNAGIDSTEWTVGGVMADLNGDTLPDIYELNYLGGSNIFTKICGSPEVPISCPPRDFDKVQDRVWLNNGDGTFNDVTNTAGVPPGKGLGIVAADINGDDRLDLFVGNDGEENYMLINESTDETIAFDEKGAALGVDLDSAGSTQACMGIAVLDLNRDRKLDFFVTNFSREFNTLYESDEYGFTDSSRKANLSSPGYGFVGFGTQALDAELDGDDDLLITNGHVQDYDDPEKPYEMPSMFLENTGLGKFRQRGSESVGNYFGIPQVGRGMARLDWNRDGLQEVVIGNLDRPTVLLKNDSEPAGKFISLKLIGVKSSRDAIGASVLVSQNGSATYRQLTAGDGYGSGNQRELNFAVDGDECDAIEIHWPGGQNQKFENVTTNRHYIAVEGRDQLFPSN